METAEVVEVQRQMTQPTQLKATGDAGMIAV
jgi:hypothetical protein